VHKIYEFIFKTCKLFFWGSMHPDPLGAEFHTQYVRNTVAL